MLDFSAMLHQDIRNPESVTQVGEDFIILDGPLLTPAGRFPYKNGWLIATLCEAGTASGTINLRDYAVTTGGFIIILPGQMIARSEMSADFQGKIILMSSQFAESLDIGRTLSLTASIESRPYYQLRPEGIGIVRSYISTCRAMIRQNGDNDSIREVLRLLSRAFFLGTRNLLNKDGNAPSSHTYGPLTEAFLTMVEKEYRTERQLEYYAHKLGRNPKYLSRRIKEETGRNASEWIDRCVILDAQSQLLSTRKTVREISDMLGFPSQSFFGKYFKRVTGKTPTAYRQLEA